MPHLTKSRFTVGLECPVKLKYLDDVAFANAKASSSFLQALAEGGHQVGALAKYLYPDGIEIAAVDLDTQLRQTAELLAREEVVIFEATFRVGALLIRADIIRKRGNRIDLMEVKAKSYDSREGEAQIRGRTGIKADFKPKLYDVAFQRYVLAQALPGAEIHCYLVMPDKAAVCSEDGVAQRLVLRRTGPRRVEVDVDPSLRDGRIARELLHVLEVDTYLDQLVAAETEMGGRGYAFADAVQTLADIAAGGEPVPRAGSYCKRCEYKATATERTNGLRDGRLACWTTAFASPVERFAFGTVFDLYRFQRAADLTANNTVALSEVSQADLRYAETAGAISQSQRQWLQCEEARAALPAAYLHEDLIRGALGRVEFPLHFIDFETATPAIPFHAGRRPYESLLFQFSHHRLEADGSLVHAAEALCVTGEFPNLVVLRQLRQAVGEVGSVIHWWTHEATILKHIKVQIEAMRPQPADAAELVAFIDGLIGTPDRPARLVDLGRHIVEKWTYFLGTQGSSSIKKVLPALLRAAPGLQVKFGQAIYGGAGPIPSRNYVDFIWVQRDAQGRVRDPYELLDSRFDDPDLDGAEDEGEGDAIADGGQAMVAYGLLLSPGLTDAQRGRLRRQLLRYCELDSLAMFLAWQGLHELVRPAQGA